MITLVKTNPTIMPVIFYDGTNIQDVIDMWGYDNIEGHNGSELSISFGDEGGNIVIPIDSYILNYLGTPVVLNQTQFLGFTDEYFAANEEEDKYFFLTRDELIEGYYETKRRQRNANKKNP